MPQDVAKGHDSLRVEMPYTAAVAAVTAVHALLLLQDCCLCQTFGLMTETLLVVWCCAGTWAYLCTISSNFVYTLVPFVSLVLGVHTVTVSHKFALAATLYFAAGVAVSYHVRRLSHLQGMWLSLVSNHLLAPTYTKATLSTLMSVIGLKRKAGFKATDKKVVAEPSLAAAAGQAFLQAVRAVSQLSVTFAGKFSTRYRPGRHAARPEDLYRTNVQGLEHSLHGEDNTSPAGPVGEGKISAAGSRFRHAPAATDAADISRQQQQQQQGQRREEASHSLRMVAGLDVSSSDAAGSKSTSVDGTATPITKSGCHPGANDNNNGQDMLGGTQGSHALVQPVADSVSIHMLTSAAAVQHAAAHTAPAVSTKTQEATKAAEHAAAKPAKPEKRSEHFSWLRSNIRNLGWALDPWVILVSLGCSCTAIAAGVWQVLAEGDRFDLWSASGVVQVFTSGHMNEFMLLALLLAGINAIPPLLFFIYCCTKGKVLQYSVYVGQAASTVLFIGMSLA
eukprot:GHRR01025018.1.p1 GENE.GHRR01025018.1~~GHRR01025018.1.p1  ORF type:complete len:506 (+),score=180.60 GHRR01025018.1:1056-2573(+)